MQDEKWDSHPTYGVVSFCRTSGSANLVGSGVSHQHFLSLSIRRAEISKAYGDERYLGKDQICEIWLSAAQFAELITTMNVMPGVPCTIKYVGREYQGEVPKANTRIKIAKDYAKERLAEFSEKIREYRAAAADILNKAGTTTKTDKGKLLSIFNDCLSEINSNMPFYADIIDEVSEKITAKAKTEIESFVTMKIMQSGVERRIKCWPISKPLP